MSDDEPMIPISQHNKLVEENQRLKSNVRAARQVSSDLAHRLAHIADAFAQNASPDPGCCYWCETAAELAKLESQSHVQYQKLHRNTVAALRLLRDFWCSFHELDGVPVDSVARSVATFLGQAVKDGFIHAEIPVTSPVFCRNCGHPEHEGKCRIGQSDSANDCKTVWCGCESFEPVLEAEDA